MLLKLPLSFIENQGQLDSSVRYYAKGSGHTVYFTEDRVVFDYIRYLDDGNRARHEPGNEPAQQKAERLVFSLVFPDANTNPVITGEAKDSGKVNYLIGNDPSMWHADIPTYQEVVYHDIYPGIDLRFYGNSGMLEYDLLVKPGARVEDIRLAYDGVDSLSLMEGELVATTPFGEMKQSKPYIYQVLGNDRVTVPGSFRLAGDNGYGFAIASYDMGYPLVIDPGIVYSTYLGGTALDEAHDVDVNSSGILLTGETNSSNFPMASSYNGTYSGTKDIFVTKLAADGQSLVFSTYLGGNNTDVGRAVCYGASDQVIIGGETVSINFPCLHADQNNFCSQSTGWTDGILTILNSAGNALVFSTYIGGVYGDTVEDVVFGYSSRIYVVGWTDSPRLDPFGRGPEYNFPVNPGGFGYQPDKTTLDADAFVLIYSSDGQTRQSSTYFGGTGAEWGYGIASAGGFPNYVYICGGTTSTDLPLADEYQNTNEGNIDAFVAAFGVLVNTLEYSTYLGSSGGDGAYSIAVKSNNDSYDIAVTGEAGGDATPFPTTAANAYKTGYGGGTDAFVAHIDTEESGSASLKYSTYFGCDGTEKGKGITWDSNGKVHVAGVTGNKVENCYCYQKNAFQPNRGGYPAVNDDAFVAKFDLLQSGNDSLLWSSYLGGSGNDWGEAVAQLNGCYTYVAGYTDSINFPTQNPYQADQGSTDAFVTQISDSEIDVSPSSVNFGNVKVGTDSTWQTVTVYSTGTGPLICGTVSIVGTNSGDFATQSDTVSGATINPGDSRTVEVKFHPTASGARTATLRIPNSDSDENPKDITLSGTGTVPDININPASHDFGSVIVGGTSTQLFTVSNTGTGDLVVTDNITILGANPGDFTIQNDNVGGQTIPPNRTLQVVFSPTATGARSATLNIWSDDPDENPKTAALDGNGLNASLSLAKYADTTVSKVGDTINYTVVITNTGGLTLERGSASDSLAGIKTDDFPPTLAASASANVTYDYTVPGGASDPLVNIITVLYHPEGLPNDVAASANVTVDLVHPGVSVLKGGPTISKVGDNITYWAAVTNTGDCTLVKDSVSDNVVAGIDGLFADTLAFGLTDNQTYTHLVQAGDPDPLSNLVTVHYHPEGLPNDITDNVTHTVDLVNPGISVFKGGPTISKVGDNITYWAAVTNTGDCTLVKDSVSDNVVAGINGLFADTLAPAVTDNQTYTHLVQAGDPDPLSNLVIVHYHPEGLTNDISDNATHTVDLVHPFLSLSKTADNTISKVGDTITYTCTITNTSPDVTLVRDSASDSLAGVITSSFPATLATGASANVTYPYTVGSGDPDPLPNTITVHYHPQGLANDITDNATCSVDLRHPDILVIKGVAAGTYRAGDVITYLVSINNMSTDIILVKDSVTDSLAGDITSLFSDNITAGGSDNQTYTYTVKSTDPDPLVNDVTVHYHPQGLPNDITDSSAANVFLLPTITSVTPGQGNQGQTLDIVITGSQLNRVNVVDFGAGITVNSITVDGPTQITVNISIDASAALGPRDVTVTNPIGTDTLIGGFTVRQSQAVSPTGRRVSPPASMSPGMSGPSQIQLQYLSVRPQQTMAGQPVTIMTNVVNTGYEAGNYNVTLKINGQVEQSRMVSVGAQGTQPVKFTVTKAQPGAYTVNIGDQKSSFVVAGAGRGPSAGMGEGILFVAAIAVIAVLVVLLMIVARRRFQG